MFYSTKNKTKIFALLSSITLWLYVTTVVDPTESRTYKDVPITISNTNIIQENNLSIFPEETLTSNITVKSNLSKLKKISKDNIIIYGSVSNPVPGKNMLTLSANLPDSIQYEIEANNLYINLESYETISKEIIVVADKKYTTDEYEIKIDKEKVDISGTKTILNKIDAIIATIKGNELDEDFSEKLELIPVDINGDKVENIKLSDKYINATITKIVKEDESLEDQILGPEENTSSTNKKDDANN